MGKPSKTSLKEALRALRSSFIVDFPPVVETSDRTLQEIVGEETTLERDADAHASSILEPSRCFLITL